MTFEIHKYEDPTIVPLCQAPIKARDFKAEPPTESMPLARARQLIEDARRADPDTKVTLREVGADAYRVRFRGHEFGDFNHAAFRLRYIAQTELLENYQCLIG